ncbi:hypothetical protein [Eubacterium aggregans]|uniref:hypothetical protein n=1 Tax=Eubacterium aggregans TaxID=81409 RepID=UPI003F3726F3
MEYRYYCRDGSIGWCLASSEVIGQVDGSRIMEGIFTNITRKQQGIESLENENALLQEMCDFTVHSKNDTIG